MWVRAISSDMAAKSLNVTGTVIGFQTTHYGLGRHIADPSVNMSSFSYSSWLGALVNTIAMALLKYSICAYLLALNFSTIYLSVVCLSTLTVTAGTFLIPLISFFSCTPFEANWNQRLPGKCFLKGDYKIVLTQVEYTRL